MTVEIAEEKILQGGKGDFGITKAGIPGIWHGGAAQVASISP